jgi:hypothetical protein
MGVAVGVTIDASMMLMNMAATNTALTATFWLMRTPPRPCASP